MVLPATIAYGAERIWMKDVCLNGLMQKNWDGIGYMMLASGCTSLAYERTLSSVILISMN